MTGSQVPQNQPSPKEPVDFEQQLHQYQKRIANILESFTDAFFEVDRNWTVTYWNREAEILLNNPRQEVIGKNLWELYPVAAKSRFFDEYHRAIKENTAVRFEEYYEPKGLWLEAAAFPSGEGLSVYFKDITAAKNAMALLKSERQRYRDLFNLSPVPQWVFDIETLNFLDVNEAAVAHYGYSKEEFLAMTIRQIRPIGDIAEFETNLRKDILQGSFSKSTVRHQKKDGTIISVQVEGNSISFEGKTARLVMVVDRTAEVDAVTAIEAQNAQLQEISWIQSHKVRSPLSSILGLVSLMDVSKTDLSAINELTPLLKESAEELDQVLREILKKIK